MTQNHQTSGSDCQSLVRLKASPLKRALCAIQFSPVLRIADPSGSGVAPFQDLIRSEYPSVQMEYAHEIEIHANEAGAIEDPRLSKRPVWKFSSNRGKWIVTLGHNILALEIEEDYEGREILVERFNFLLGSLSNCFKDLDYTRLGFRFFNLFQGEKLAKIEDYINPKILRLKGDFEGYSVGATWSAVQLKAGKNDLRVQYGRAPAGMQSDMQTIPLDNEAWVLDIDGSQSISEASPFDLQTASAEITDAVCHFFSWSVTKKFIEDYRHDKQE